MFGLGSKSSKSVPPDRDESVYSPLQDQSSSASEKDYEEHVYDSPKRKKASRWFSHTVVCLLLVTNVLMATGLAASRYLIVQLEAKEPQYTPKSAGTYVASVS